LELWYKQTAANWNEALPVGNGWLGAMVFGDPVNESYQVNEESSWAGSKINNNYPEGLNNLPALQQTIFRGEIWIRSLKTDPLIHYLNKLLL